MGEAGVSGGRGRAFRRVAGVYPGNGNVTSVCFYPGRRLLANATWFHATTNQSYQAEGNRRGGHSGMAGTTRGGGGGGGAGSRARL